MATKGERQALLFLAAVAVLGAGTRLYRARRPAADDRALTGQLAALDSARGRERFSTKGRKPRKPEPERIAAPLEKLDLDRATPQEIERLPGIGPALAKRIVANRDSAGSFGCLAAVDTVKGIGPSLLRQLDTLVVFSGARRSGC